MTVSDVIQIISIICSSVLSIVAIVISVLTLVQNNKMIFESNKPNIVIFSKVISFTSPYSYLILKNFGNSGATILNIKCNKDLKSFFDRVPFKNLENTFIAPNKSFVYPLLPNVKLDETISFTINYKYLNKAYSENYVVTFEHYKDIAYTKVHSSKDIKELSDVLQEMIIQNV